MAFFFSLQYTMRLNLIFQSYTVRYICYDILWTLKDHTAQRSVCLMFTKNTRVYRGIITSGWFIIVCFCKWIKWRIILTNLIRLLKNCYQYPHWNLQHILFHANFRGILPNKLFAFDDSYWDSDPDIPHLLSAIFSHNVLAWFIWKKIT